MKITLNKFIIFFILSTFLYGKNNRDIIKAYNKGKPAKMNIEITKLKTTNYIDFFIDRDNKKIYKEITTPNKENRDLKKKLYITDYYKKIRNFRDISSYPYKIKNINNKTYLIISYINEPTNIYLWLLEGKKLQKLYTGILKEFLDPTNPISYIDLKKTCIIKDDNKKFISKDDKFIYYKIANIKLKDDSKDNISLKLKDKYAFYHENIKISSDIDFYFKEGNSYKKSALLTPNKKEIEIIGKLNRNILTNRKIIKGFFKDLNEKNENKFSLDVNFEKTKITSKELIFKDYYINSFEKTVNRILDIYAYGEPESDGYFHFNLKPSSDNSFSNVEKGKGITQVIGSTCIKLSKYKWNHSSNNETFFGYGLYSNIITTNSNVNINHPITDGTPPTGQMLLGDYIYGFTHIKGNKRKIQIKKIPNKNLQNSGLFGKDPGDLITYKLFFPHRHGSGEGIPDCPNNLINIHFNNGDSRLTLYTSNMNFINLTPTTSTHDSTAFVGIAGAEGFSITETTIEESTSLIYKDSQNFIHTLKVNPISMLGNIETVTPNNKPPQGVLPNEKYSHFFKINGTINTDSKTQIGTYNGSFNVSVTASEKTKGGRF